MTLIYICCAELPLIDRAQQALQLLQVHTPQAFGDALAETKCFLLPFGFMTAAPPLLLLLRTNQRTGTNQLND